MYDVYSFSGGKTSAFMTAACLASVSDRSKTIVLFANTGEEDEGTLKFVNDCDRYFGFNVVWIEAVVEPGRRGSTHEIVTYETATRGKKLFENMVAKYGLPNPSYPHCTRELKLNPIRSFLRSVGLETGSYRTYIGIRSDEIDRINPKYKELFYEYPLAWAGVTKRDVNEYFSLMPFTLEVPEELGNCATCYKKTDRKLCTIAVNHPEKFETFRFLEKNYAAAGAGDGERRFFRKHRTVDDIFDLSRKPFEQFKDPYFDYDLAGGCSETCEVFG